MNYISDVLYWISTGLLVPVIVLLIVLFVRSLLLVGSFFGQYLASRKIEAWIGLQKRYEPLVAADLQTCAAKQTLFFRTATEMFALSTAPVERKYLLTTFELAADKELANSKTLAKMGPMLGLMGTLIPMGPALVGLSQGDIASMAYNMQVAFSTTVVGLFIAAIGYITLQVKQRWYYQQLATLEYMHEVLTIQKGD